MLIELDYKPDNDPKNHVVFRAAGLIQLNPLGRYEIRPVVYEPNAPVSISWISGFSPSAYKYCLAKIKPGGEFQFSRHGALLTVRYLKEAEEL